MQICAFRKEHKDEPFLGSISGDGPFILSPGDQAALDSFFLSRLLYGGRKGSANLQLIPTHQRTGHIHSKTKETNF